MNIIPPLAVIEQMMSRIESTNPRLMIVGASVGVSAAMIKQLSNHDCKIIVAKGRHEDREFRSPTESGDTFIDWNEPLSHMYTLSCGPDINYNETHGSWPIPTKKTCSRSRSKFDQLHDSKNSKRGFR